MAFMRMGVVETPSSLDLFVEAPAHSTGEAQMDPPDPLDDL